MTSIQPPSLTDDQYVSRFAIEDIGIVVHIAGVPADPDNNDVTVSMRTNDVDGVLIFSRAATHDGVGIFSTMLSSVETSDIGRFVVEWSFTINNDPQSIKGYIEIGNESPAYDQLSPAMKGVVESVWVRFADLFDSPSGGPNLQTYYQANWSRGRVAQIMVQAIERLNVSSQPTTTYSAYAPSEFPVANWSGVLHLATYIECIRHLIRSYSEQPDAQGVNVPRLDRSRYAQQWKSVLDMEIEDFRMASQIFKMKHMNLGRPRVLVSGGVFGHYGPTRISNSAAARPRYWARFY